MRLPLRSIVLLCVPGLAWPVCAASAPPAPAPGAELSATARAIEAAEQAPLPRLDAEPAPSTRSRVQAPRRSAAEAQRILDASTLPAPAAQVAPSSTVAVAPAAPPAHRPRHRPAPHRAHPPRAPRQWATASGGIGIDVLDRLAPEQYGERLSLWLEGRRVADFTLGEDTRAVWTHIPLPAPGRLRYELRGTSDTEARGEHRLSGRGCVVIDHGRRYGIARRGAQLALLPIGAGPR